MLDDKHLRQEITQKQNCCHILLALIHFVWLYCLEIKLSRLLTISEVDKIDLSL